MSSLKCLLHPGLEAERHRHMDFETTTSAPERDRMHNSVAVALAQVQVEAGEGCCCSSHRGTQEHAGRAQGKCNQESDPKSIGEAC